MTFKALFRIQASSTVCIKRFNKLYPRHQILNLIDTHNLSSKRKITAAAEVKEVAKMDLSSFLIKELEEEIETKTSVKENLSAFLQRSGFELKQEEGHNIVHLIKKHKKETIRISFSISDLNQPCIDPRDPIDFKLFSQFDEFPIRCHIKVSKPNYGTLLFDSLISDGYFGFNTISYYPKYETQPHEVSTPLLLNNKINQWKFEILHEELKSGFEDYLEARGIDEDMASFIRAFIYFKEQNEYVKWLLDCAEFCKAN